MIIKKCVEEDIRVLADMNKMLIEDEGSDNPMNISQLEERMKGFLEGEYDAYFFIEKDTIVGYALVRHTSDPFYLRQFFICRDQRMNHYGTRAFRLLMDYLNIAIIDIDVLTDNNAGMAFWKSCGFEERYVGMRLKK